MATFVYPFESKVIDIAADQTIAISTTGNDGCKLYQSVNSGITWELLGTVKNDEKLFDIVAGQIRIDAGADQVVYRRGSSVTYADQVMPPVPASAHVYLNDFDTYTSGQWTVTAVEAGAGSASQAIIDGDGGLFKITNDAADDDSCFMQKVGESFLFESGKKLWFEARMKVSDATQSDFVMGLQITDTTPLDVTDGVFFLKSDGSAVSSFRVEKNNTASTISTCGTWSDGVFKTIGFYYDGDSTISAYVNRVLVNSVDTTNMPDDEELTISFGIQNGEAVAKNMTIDYIMCAKER